MVKMKRIYRWTHTKIAEWNKATFPKNSAILQLLKIEEEMKEMDKELGISFERWIEEWADISIACAAGWYRFKLVTALNILKLIESMPEYHLIMEARDKKMDVNIKRIWEGNNHVEEIAC